MSSVSLPVVGGRDGGYRTYSTRENPEQGKWRVNIETPHGQIIGRIYFAVSHTQTEPTLITETKN
jgi:hypothetical protein